MHGSVRQIEHECQAHADDKAHGNCKNTSSCEQSPMLDRINPSQEQESVNEHEEVANRHFDTIKKYGT